MTQKLYARKLHIVQKFFLSIELFQLITFNVKKTNKNLIFDILYNRK
ncbi:hypothetical protein BARBAKC583_0422 [Bartonella bacilliformis KC583]|uniref:Uncharacterized protein n=1 Tax=Bartonella bacilliformis (strain ATCC 35685 / KC583 / Herrer 020/F12,63) TaxID=360095 RepID=A1URY7_BARBK|nr:hypothetical protein BARBAKC583_0422 [Bartonella bacilliformis KC583]